MNQTDYKAIAGILKEWNHDYEAICEELADYFEKEAKEIDMLDKKDWLDKDEPRFVKMFNREQFLKDCGVTK